MPRILFLTCVVSVLCFGCKKPSPPPATASGTTNSGTQTNVADADLPAILAGLTQALRKFSVEQRKVPASLNELVAAGYLPGVPQAPGGKAFVIDSKNLQVIVQ